jgi:GntR family transcriptional regulator
VAARPESAGEHVAEALRIEAGSPTLYVERLRIADGEPLLLEQVHLPAERFPGLLASDLEHGSLYDLLTVRYGTRIARARESLEPVLLHTREAALLAQPVRAPALLIEGIAYAVTGEPVEFARSYVRGDRTRYYIERIVVRSSWQTDETGPGAQPTAATGATAPQRPRATTHRRRRPTAGATSGWPATDRGGGAAWHRD